MNIRTQFLAAALLGTFASCALADDLWGESKASPFRPEKKKFSVHDRVSIKVNEKETASADADLTTDRRSRWNADLRKWIKIAQTKNGPRLREALGPVNKKTLPTPSIDAEDRFREDDTATTKRDSSLIFEIEATVVAVLPNGDLVVEARKKVQINGENETMTLSGEIRQDDVDGVSNSIDSEKIANLDVHYDGAGDIGDPTHSGWLSKFLNKWWPFW